MKESKPDFTQFVGNKEWLSKISVPVVLFFWCGWREKCNYMRVLIERLMKDYPKINFYWVDADVDGGICKEFFVPDVPALLILKDGKEMIRFTCASSEGGIRHHLDELIKTMERPAESANISLDF